MSDKLIEGIVAGFNRRNPGSEKCHWTEDFVHENGIYENICCVCTKHFLGYKRRVICKVCSTLPPEKKDAEVRTD